MGRNLIFLLLAVIGLMVVKSIVSQIIGAVTKGLRSETRRNGQNKREAQEAQRTSGRLVRDPVSGVYIDEQLAVKEIINGKPMYFESKANRDSYLKQHAG
jgi:YHS domain-containing protein